MGDYDIYTIFGFDSINPFGRIYFNGLEFYVIILVTSFDGLIGSWEFINLTCVYGLIASWEFINLVCAYGLIYSFTIAYFFGTSVVIIFVYLIGSFPLIYLEPFSGELIVMEFVCFIVFYFGLGEVGYFFIYFVSFI